MEEVDAIFALGDVNGDGQIDMGEFISIGMEMVPLKRICRCSVVKRISDTFMEASQNKS